MESATILTAVVLAVGTGAAVAQDTPALAVVNLASETLPVAVARVPGAAGRNRVVLRNLRPGERRVCRSEDHVPAPTANWDEDANTGVLDNGVLRFAWQSGGGALNWSGSEDTPLLTGLHYRGWLDTEARGHVEKPAEIGLVPIDTSHAELVSSRAALQDGAARLELRRRYTNQGIDVACTEAYTLVPFEPCLAHRIELRNAGTESAFIAWADNVIAGRFTETMTRLSDPYRGGRRQALTKGASLWAKWAGVAAPPGGFEDAPPDAVEAVQHLWAAVQGQGGPGFGFMTLKRLHLDKFHNKTLWRFSDRGFSLEQVDPERGAAPIRIEPGATVVLGARILVSPPGVDPVANTRDWFCAAAKGGEPASRWPCAVFADGVPVQAAEVKVLDDRFADLARWSCTAGQAVAGKDGVTLTAEDGVAALQTALALDRSRSYRVRLDCARAGAGAVGLWFGPLSGDGPLTRLGETATGESIAVDLPAGSNVPRVENVLLAIRCSGEGAIVLARFGLQPAPLPAPELVSPVAGMETTDIAASFCWREVAQADRYELQFAREPGLADTQAATVAKERAFVWFFPKELPTPGVWYWRVRSVSDDSGAGVWSDVRSVIVNADHTRRALIRPVSPDRPLFTLEAHKIYDLEVLRDAVPPDIRPFTAIVVANNALFTTKDTMALFEPARAQDNAWFIRTHGPKGMANCVPLAEVEWLFREHPHIIGVHTGENLWGLLHNPTMQRYVKRLIMLCAKYGRLYIWGDGNGTTFKLQQLASDPEWAPFLREHAEVLVMSQKNNVNKAFHTTQGATMGMWLTGMIGQLGSWCEFFYWNDAGFGDLGERLGAKNGALNKFPPIFYSLSFLHGMAQGATVFNVDGQGTSGNTRAAIWNTRGETTETFRRIIVPFIRAVVKHQLIPSKAEVLANVRLAVRQPERFANVRHHGTYQYYRPLYEATYGLRDGGEEYEFIPNTSRTYFFPLLPYGCDSIGDGPLYLDLPALKTMSADAIRSVVEQACPDPGRGSAFSVQIGDRFFVQNTHENEDVSEDFRLAFGNGPTKGLSGRIGPHHYVMGRLGRGGRTLWLQANTDHPGRETTLTLTCATWHNIPVVKTIPETAATVGDWDAKAGTLTLRLSHAAGPVEVAVTNMHPAFVPPVDDPELPRVLLIGDSVSIGYTLDVRKELAGIANVHRPAANCGSTKTALRSYGLERWLGDTTWDVIHFNHGLHDLGYRFDNDRTTDANGNYATPENGGHQNVPPPQYEQNLRRIVARLKQTGAKLIFAATTPVPDCDARFYIESAEAPYNEIARGIMAEEGVTLNDLWALASARQDELQIPRNVHFHKAGSAVLAKQVAQSIAAMLQQAPPESRK